MRAVVRDNFVRFTSPLEGVVFSMYADVKSLITTGIGNLIDSPAAAAVLPWRHPDGSRATKSEIVAEWQKVKAGCCGSYPRCSWGPERVCFAHKGWTASAKVTRLRLTQADVDLLVTTVMDRMWGQLVARFPDAESWPADAQLATLSMAWACGPAFRFPMLARSLTAGNFAMAALHCQMKGAGTVTIRNAHDKALYRNAARVVADGLDPERLYFPRDLEAATVPSEAETVPVLPDDPDDEVTDVMPVPEMREPPFAKVTIIHPKIEFPKRNYPDPDDEPA